MPHQCKAAWQFGFQGNVWIYIPAPRLTWYVFHSCAVIQYSLYNNVDEVLAGKWSR